MKDNLKPTQKKIINLAIVAMGVLFIGSEIIVDYISKEPYSTHQVRPWFALLIVSFYYVFAVQISERSNNRNNEKI